jgi:hypothetical protein
MIEDGMGHDLGLWFASALPVLGKAGSRCAGTRPNA